MSLEDFIFLFSSTVCVTSLTALENSYETTWTLDIYGQEVLRTIFIVY